MELFGGPHGERKKQTVAWGMLQNGTIPDEMLEEIFSIDGDAPVKAKLLYGGVYRDEKGELIREKDTRYDFSRYRYLIKAPFKISSACCDVMKKSPGHAFQKQTGKKPMLATMASESRLRTQHWLRNGCNGFEMKTPVSNPMAFWTESDVLLYIRENNLKICSLYGDIVDENKTDTDGQMSLEDLGLFEKERPCLTTTGVKRTGCMFCLYGIQQEKSPNRLEQLKITHPKIYEFLMKPESEGGMGYKEKIDWINEHGGYHIKY